MKATIDIPDDLYRRVKARTALEGRPLRSVAIELFQQWLSRPVLPPAALAEDAVEKAPWLAITRPYMKAGMSHDLEAMDAAIARGWGSEAAGASADPAK